MAGKHNGTIATIIWASCSIWLQGALALRYEDGEDLTMDDNVQAKAEGLEMERKAVRHQTLLETDWLRLLNDGTSEAGTIEIAEPDASVAALMEQGTYEPAVPFAWTSNLVWEKKLGEGSFGIVHKMRVSCNVSDDEASHVVMKIQNYATAEVHRKKQIDAETKYLLKMSTQKSKSPYVLGLAGGKNGVKYLGTEIYYLMEMMNYGELSHIIDNDAPDYEPIGGRAVAFGLIVHVLKGLQAMHAQKLVHIDIKPPNVMINCNEYAGLHCFAAVIDLGVSIPQGNPDGVGLRGTPAYIAPEAAIAFLSNTPTVAEPANDVYAVGTMLYEMYFHGRLPSYDHPNPITLLRKQIKWSPTTDDILMLARRRGSQEDRLAARVISNMMEPNPAKRWTVAMAIDGVKELAMALVLRDIHGNMHQACVFGAQVHRLKEGMFSRNKNKCPQENTGRSCPHGMSTFCLHGHMEQRCCCRRSDIVSHDQNKTAGRSCAGNFYDKQAQEARDVSRQVSGMDRDPSADKARKALPKCLELGIKAEENIKH